MDSSLTSARTTGSMATPNRWVIAIAAFFMQLALGAIYGWSVFLKKI